SRSSKMLHWLTPLTGGLYPGARLLKRQVRWLESVPPKACGSKARSPLQECASLKSKRFLPVASTGRRTSTPMLRPAGYFGCDDQLAHMTLSVLRQVYHQSNHSSRQMFSSHAS